MTSIAPVLDEKTTQEIFDKLDDIQLPVPEYKNAPEDIESAIQRIMALETALEDLSRAIEIAVISRQFELVDGFRSRADEMLQNKITVVEPERGPMKITILKSNKDAEGSTT
jgi:hypothetical protein